MNLMSRQAFRSLHSFDFGSMNDFELQSGATSLFDRLMSWPLISWTLLQAQLSVFVAPV